MEDYKEMVMLDGKINGFLTGKPEWKTPNDLPETDGIVLAIIKHEAGERAYGFAYYYLNEWHIIFSPYSTVIAWCVLPEPPKA